jgi:hypothetical protein
MLSTLEVSLTLDHQDAPEIFSQGFYGLYKHMRLPVFAHVIETGTEERVKYVFGLKPDDITLEALLSLEHRNNTQLSDWSVYPTQFQKTCAMSTGQASTCATRQSKELVASTPVCIRPQQDQPGPTAVIEIQGFPTNSVAVQVLDATQEVLWEVWRDERCA